MRMCATAAATRVKQTTVQQRVSDWTLVFYVVVLVQCLFLAVYQAGMLEPSAHCYRFGSDHCMDQRDDRSGFQDSANQWFRLMLKSLTTRTRRRSCNHALKLIVAMKVRVLSTLPF